MSRLLNAHQFVRVRKGELPPHGKPTILEFLTSIIKEVGCFPSPTASISREPIPRTFLHGANTRILPTHRGPDGIGTVGEDTARSHVLCRGHPEDTCNHNRQGAFGAACTSLKHVSEATRPQSKANVTNGRWGKG
jgi:hypothetical protein